MTWDVATAEIVVTAAKKYGAKGTGYDIDPKRIYESRENVRKNGVETLVTIKQADLSSRSTSRKPTS